MVDLAILIGIFSYLVFGLGILGVLGVLGIFGIIFFLTMVLLAVKKKTGKWFEENWREIKKDRINILIVSLLFLCASVNLIGALGPELGFDSLWYHLTIPKIYLSQQRIFFIPGNLFYYSAMPKLTEMLYLTSLVFSPSGILAKLIHFSFGLLSAAALLNLSRRYLNMRFSLIAVLVFYSTLIVGWQSITAYIDLSRTFFEILALDLFLKWTERSEKRKMGNEGKKGNWELIDSAAMLGLAISTKLIAFASLPVFLILILIKSKKILPAVSYLLFAVLIPLPWFVFSYISTHNPIYPLFSGVLDVSHQFIGFNLIRFFLDLWKLFYWPQDAISPIFLIFIPFLIWKGMEWAIRNRGLGKLGRLGWLGILGGFVLLSLIFWYFTPRTGGSRFALPYLPALSLLMVGIISKAKKYYQKILISLCILVAFINLGYRALANKKYLPVVLGLESKEQFLSNNLNFEFGDFYDVDGDLKEIVKNDDLVLIYGAHNLFYADFPFIHESSAKPGTYFSYVLVQGEDIPRIVTDKKLVYKNNTTKISLYLFGDKL